MTNRKVIIVGPEAVHEFIAGQFQYWDCQDPSESITDLWAGLKQGTLSTSSDIVIFVDVVFADDPEGFIEAISNFAANALVMVLAYNPDWQDQIQTLVNNTEANDEYQQIHRENLPFYFIQTNTAVVSIEEIVNFYDNRAIETVKFREEAAKPINADAQNKINHHPFTKRGAVVTVTSSKGGSGKSTVALLLGAQVALSSKKAYEQGLVKEPLRVCVIDLDTFDGQLGFVLSKYTPTALNVYMAEKIRDEELIWNNLIYSERMGIHALLAPVRGVTAHYLDAAFYQDVITKMRSMFDLIILDTSVQHYDEIIDKVALPIADAILVVTTLDIKSVRGLARWMKTAEAKRKDGGHELNDMGKIGVVVNGSIHGVNMGEDQLTDAAMGSKLLVSIPLETMAVQSAGNAGRLEELILSHPTLGEAYFSLAEKITSSFNTTLVPLLEEGDTGTTSIVPGRGPKPPNNSGGKAKPPIRKPRRLFGGIRK